MAAYGSGRAGGHTPVSVSWEVQKKSPGVFSATIQQGAARGAKAWPMPSSGRAEAMERPSPALTPQSRHLLKMPLNLLQSGVH